MQKDASYLLSIDSSHVIRNIRKPNVELCSYECAVNAKNSGCKTFTYKIYYHLKVPLQKHLNRRQAYQPTRVWLQEYPQNKVLDCRFSLEACHQQDSTSPLVETLPPLGHPVDQDRDRLPQECLQGQDLLLVILSLVT